MVHEQDATAQHNNEKSAEVNPHNIPHQTSTNQSVDHSEEKNILKERQQKIIAFLKNYFTENIVTGKSTWPYHVLLVILLWISVYIRTLPMRIIPGTGKPGLWDVAKNTWTLGPDLDPFLFLRLAKYIIAHGSLPAVDTMRFVPLGLSTESETQLFPHMIAWTYKILAFFSPNVSVEYAAVVFPVIISLFTAIAFFLFVRKVFEHKGVIMSHSIALIATAYLVTLPSLLPRTIAGIPEKESPGFMFMFLSLYFFLLAWKSDTTIRAAIFGVFAGVFTALMGLVWGGAIFVFTAIDIAVIALFFMGRLRMKESILYILWLCVSVFLLATFSARFSVNSILFSPLHGFPGGVLLLAIISLVVAEKRLLPYDFFPKAKGKIPEPVLIVGVASVFGILISSIMSGPSFLITVFREAISLIYSSSSNRINLTVAENKQPYFVDWKESFGPFWGEFPLFFWLFFIGSVLLFWELTACLSRKRNRIVLTGSYTVMLAGIIFSRTSPSSVFNGVSQQSKIFYSGGVLLFLIALGYTIYQEYCEKKSFDKRAESYILVLALIIVSVVAGRGFIRLIMVLAVSATIFAAYLVVELVSLVWKKRSSFRTLPTLIFFAIATIVVLATFSTLQENYRTSEGTASVYVPSSYTQQWQKAMAWVQQNTPQDAVFGHWWDYGYWVQTLGGRATMLDGGNAIGYWNYLMGRHVLTAQSEEEALEVLYAHNISYLLVDPTDIGKYTAFSSIGSDENYDRYSYLGTLLKNNEITQTVNGTTLIVYQGGVSVEEGITFKENGGDVFLPPGIPVQMIVFPVTTVGNQTDFGQPYTIFIYQNREYKIPLQYVYINGQEIDFKSGLPGALVLIPKLVVSGEGRVSIDALGAAFFLTPRNVRALWVRLYLLNKGEHFELVHNQPSPLVEGVRSQGAILPDFVYFNGVQGPIKIWKVNYSGNETINEEYIQTSFPERLRGRVFAG